MFGHTSLNDGNPRQYYWNGSSTSPDNNDTIIRPTQILDQYPGRWIKVVNANEGGSSVTLPRVLKRSITGNSSTIQYSFQHDWNTRNVFVQVYEDNETSSTLPNINVDVNINVFTDAIRINFVKAPVTDKKYLVLIQEVLTD